jgi:NifU-like protein involved in Fe-S cluster formation
MGSADHGGQAPRIKFLFRFDGAIVKQAAFQTFGCGVAIAAGSILTEMVIGQSVEDCRKISTEEVSQALDGVPEDRRYCLDVAVEALRRGLAQYVGRKTDDADSHDTVSPDSAP